MTVTFLDHSGFLVELPSVTLLFDWWRGALPPLRQDVPLLVFASHAHEDHFSPAVFTLPAAAFVLGKDIRPRRLERLGIAPEEIAKCRFAGGGETLYPLPGVTVETLPSTDEGVAFAVTADGKTVFHAGDLNWWHWAGEDPEWNRSMAADFLRCTQPLRGRAIDLALLPLDPRLGTDGFRGPRHILETAAVRRFLPMHQWGDFAFTDAFLAEYPAFAAVTVPVRFPGQRFTFG